MNNTTTDTTTTSNSSLPFPDAPSILSPLFPFPLSNVDSNSDFIDDDDYDSDAVFYKNLFARSEPDNSEDSDFEGIAGSDLELGLAVGFGADDDDDDDGDWCPEIGIQEGDGLRVAGTDSDSDSEGEDEGFDADDQLNWFEDLDRPRVYWEDNGEHDDEDDDDDDDGFSDGGNVGDAVYDRDGAADDDEEEEEEEEEEDFSGDERGIGVDFSDIVGDREWYDRASVDPVYEEREGFEDLEWESVFVEAGEDMSSLMGNPPAARSVIESLPIVDLVEEGLLEEGITLCAICKDEFSAKEKARQLPCCHYYHGDCIMPWLRIRNTCPVCRYELPTDDHDYEYRKREWIGEGDDDGLDMDSEIGYDLHMFFWWVVTRFSNQVGRV